MASLIPTPDPGFNVTVTKEELNLFHNIDRQLFTRLVVGLGRDTTQSTHVMAFILWVEKKSNDSSMVPNLLQWSDTMLSNLADEVIVVLNCIESAHFPYPSVNEKGLPLIQNVMRCAVTLQYFHDNRMEIITAVTRLINDVCLRAFTDIVQQVQYAKAVKERNFYFANVYGATTTTTTTSLNPYVQQVVYYAAPAGVAIVPQQIVIPQWNEASSNNNVDNYDVSPGHNMDNNRELTDILAKLDLDANADSAAETTLVIAATDKRKEVPFDDRTMFMTFSKGYPISEIEVREFFTRKYGDIVEAMLMQDVPPPEQPLYARLVFRPEAAHVIDIFLENNAKIKFAINGKHVWARKYIRKLPSPSEPGTSHSMYF